MTRRVPWGGKKGGRGRAENSRGVGRRHKKKVKRIENRVRRVATERIRKYVKKIYSIRRSEKM